MFVHRPRLQCPPGNRHTFGSFIKPCSQCHTFMLMRHKTLPFPEHVHRIHIRHTVCLSVSVASAINYAFIIGPSATRNIDKHWKSSTSSDHLRPISQWHHPPFRIDCILTSYIYHITVSCKPYIYSSSPRYARATETTVRVPARRPSSPVGAESEARTYWIHSRNDYYCDFPYAAEA